VLFAELLAILSPLRIPLSLAFGEHLAPWSVWGDREVLEGANNTRAKHEYHCAKAQYHFCEAKISLKK